MANILIPIMRGKRVVVGIGNPLRGDDGFGPSLIAKLQESCKGIFIDAGFSPENHLGRILKEEPDTILLVDVAHLDLRPGEYRILKPQDMLKCGLTTHEMSTRMLIDFLEKETKADIFMLGVQPQTLALGQAMSEPLSATLNEVEKLINEAMHA